MAREKAHKAQIADLENQVAALKVSTCARQQDPAGNSFMTVRCQTMDVALISVT